MGILNSGPGFKVHSTPYPNSSPDPNLVILNGPPGDHIQSLHQHGIVSIISHHLNCYSTVFYHVARVGPRLFSPAFQWMHPIDHMDVVWSIFQSPNVGILAFLGAVLSLPCGKCREDHIILPPVHIVVLEQTHDPRSC